LALVRGFLNAYVMVGKSRSGEEGVDVCPLFKASLRRDAKMGSSMLDHEFENMVGALYERFFDETAAEVFVRLKVAAPAGQKLNTLNPDLVK
jgi:hypothetical protein